MGNNQKPPPPPPPPPGRQLDRPVPVRKPKPPHSKPKK